MCLVAGCVKFVVFGFNLLFVLAGIALIVVGVIYKLNFTDLTDAIPDAYDNISLAPILTIVIGCLIFAIAFFGCCGALRSSSCLLTTYAVILLTIFILQIALGVFAFLEVKDKNDLEKEVNRTIEDIFNKYSEKNKTRELVDFMQQELKCCGVKDSSSWVNKIPDSCCDDKDCSKNRPYSEGCQSTFFDFLNDSAKIIGIVVLCLSATEVFGAIVSLCLANSIRNDGRRGRYA